jgi:uncharacterized phage protein (TIGR02218 family)
MKAVVADYRYRVLCLRIVPVLGTVVRLTHHPRDLKMSNGEVYLAFRGNDFSGYSAGASMSPAMVDLEGVLGFGGITRDQIASGVYDGARCYLFATSWRAPVEDQEPIVASLLGRTSLLDGRFKTEEMALVDALGQTVGDSYSPSCKKVFGGQEYAGCKIDLGPLTVTGSITSVVSASVLQDASRTEVADYFGAGTLRFTSGDNAGLPGIGIKRHEADGSIELFEPPHYPAAVGDDIELVPGCRKGKSDCANKWNNILNFGGFSFVPTTSIYSQVGTK